MEAINPMSSVYAIAGRCCDLLDNRPRAIACLTTAVRVDLACTEVCAVRALCVEKMYWVTVRTPGP